MEKLDRKRKGLNLKRGENERSHSKYPGHPGRGATVPVPGQALRRSSHVSTNAPWRSDKEGVPRRAEEIRRPTHQEMSENTHQVEGGLPAVSLQTVEELVGVS